MSSVFDQIQRGMEEAIAFAEGRPSRAVVHHFTALDVKAIQRQVGMTQIEFAKAFRISCFCSMSESSHNNEPNFWIQWIQYSDF